MGTGDWQLSVHQSPDTAWTFVRLSYRTEIRDFQLAPNDTLHLDVKNGTILFRGHDVGESDASKGAGPDALRLAHSRRGKLNV